MLPRVVVLLRLALSNLLASLLNVFVGLVLLFGAALLVIGGSIFTTLDGALSRSIIDSLSGHLQVYAGRSKDPLELYGKIDGSDSNLAPLDDWKGLKATLLSHPNVARVVPMGAATAIVGSGNTVDVTLEKLRGLYRDQADPQRRREPEVFAPLAASLKAHVRNIVDVLVKDAEREKELIAEQELDQAARAALATAASDDFWATFDEEPLAHLELLENRIAPLAADADLLFMRYVGTDLALYQDTFSRMRIVEGGPVPPGTRGALLPRYFMEEYLKLKNARRLDKLRDALAAGRRLADPKDQELQRWSRENQAQTRELVLQLDALETADAVARLQRHLGAQEADLAALLTRFFTVTDENFEARYRFFYDELAPLFSLYRARVGDTLTLKSFGRSGAVETATLKVYGVFEMSGLEKSPLAGVNALVDIVTFRDLYGYVTAEKQAELDAMKAETGAREVSREDAEAALFGDDAELVQATTAAALATPESLGAGRGAAARRAETYPPSEVDEGVVLNAAVVLKDGSPLAQLLTQRELEAALAGSAPPPDAAAVRRARELLEKRVLPFALQAALEPALVAVEARAAGGPPAPSDVLLAFQAAYKGERATLADEHLATLDAFFAAARPRTWVVGWGSAAGFLGKFIDFFRLLLVAVVGAFAFIALIVVTIGMTIATMQRTATIGTMRAIGAQRTFIMAMVLLETAVLALVFGLVGAGLGALVVQYLHATGIPAFRDELYFFFSGPVLRPELSLGGFALSVVVTLVVSLLAVIFPTVLAMRIAPVTAMQAAE
jgi:ABC-type lipoprotein release transport system permease subunit